MQHLRFASLMLAVLAAGACGDDGGGFNPSDDVQIRALNAAPGAPAMEVRIGGTTIADNLTYSASTAYQTIQGGTHTLQVKSDFDDQHDELASVEAPLTAGAAYTVIVAGHDGGVAPFLLTDDIAVPPTGQMKFRAVHAADGASEVDVYVTAPGADLSATTPMFTAIAFGKASSYATLPPGAYQVRMTATGSLDVLTDTGALAFNEGEIRTAVAVESPAGGAPYSAVLLDGGSQ